MLIIVFRCAGGALILFAWLAWRRELERTTWAQWRTAAIAGLLLFLGSHVVAGVGRAADVVRPGRAVRVGDPALDRPHGIHEGAHDADRARARSASRSASSAWACSPAAAHSTPASPSDRVLVALGAFCWAAGSLVGRHGARPRRRDPGNGDAARDAAPSGCSRVSALRGDLAHFSLARLDLRTDAGAGLPRCCAAPCSPSASFTWLLRVASPAAVSSYAFVNPIVALALGVAVGDDVLSGSHSCSVPRS